MAKPLVDAGFTGHLEVPWPGEAEREEGEGEGPQDY